MSSSSASQSITIEDKYQSKTLDEQILDEPDTYIGSLQAQTEMMWVMDNETKRMKKEKITYIPGLYKLFDEILVNAIDQWVRQSVKIKEGEKIKPVRNIKIWVNEEEGTISVYNDGDGIDVAMHQKEKMYVPQMIFGKLLTSGNYRNHEKGLNLTKITGGKNGYGSKLTSLFSTKFIVETVDASRKKKYVQVFENNLSVINEPKITSSSVLPYTKITFKPDLEKFKMDELSGDIIRLIEKRAYDTAGYCEGVNVYYNDQKIDVKDFERYTYLYLGNKSETKRVFIKANERWEICVCASKNHELEQVSFVNGIWTTDGGKHVDYIADQVARKISKDLTKGKTKVDAATVKSNLWVFVKCVIENPQFRSQAKEKLTTLVDKFGSKCTLSAAQITEMGKCGINVLAKNFSQFKEAQLNVRNNGKKTSKVYMDKLDEGDYPGTRKSVDCTLVLTEGESAKPFVTNGLMALSEEQRKYWGVFPLKGKILNTRNCTPKQLGANEEIKAIMKILALQKDVDYSQGINRLRYGHLMILTDQDVDGEHIKGLLISFIHHFWPSLLARNDFIRCMVTPLIMNWKEKAVPGKRKTIREPLNKFYSKAEYLRWKGQHENDKGWVTRYYKGLGTSKEEDAKASFRDMKKIQFIDDDSDDTTDVIKLAFEKSRADDRKKWLYNDAYSEDKLDYNVEIETYPDFINKRLKLFSLDDCSRSIPNLVDGLKPSQRKIIYTVLKKNIHFKKKSVKVEQLVGLVTAFTAYHHGEASLGGAIVNLAQNFVGCGNNINLLYPDGNFGSRLKNGKDSSATRYIYTKMEAILPLIFRKEDLPIYEYAEDDDMIVEPTFFAPVVPMLLINGAEGIGTGFSTTVPSYNPNILVERIKKRLKNSGLAEEEGDLVPWYRGFKGQIRAVAGKNSYEITGRYTFGDNCLKIQELPVGYAFNQYKIFLQSLEKPLEKPSGRGSKGDTKAPSDKFKLLHGLVKSVNVDASSCTAQVYFIPGGLNKLLAKGVDYLEKEFKLRTSISTNNLTAFNENIELKQFETSTDLLDNYYQVRLNFYQKRKDYMISDCEEEISRLSAKYRFVCEIMDEKIIIKRKKKVEIIQILEEGEYPRFIKKDYRKKDGVAADADIEEILDDQENQDEDGGSGKAEGYEYLLNMKIYSFSEEILAKLLRDKEAEEERLTKIKNDTVQEMWLRDLAEFEKEYKFFMEDWYDANGIKPPAGKIQLGLSRRGSASSSVGE